MIPDSPPKVPDEAVRGAVHGAVYGAVDRAVYRGVCSVVRWSVINAVHAAVWWTVQDTMRGFAFLSDEEAHRDSR